MRKLVRADSVVRHDGVLGDTVLIQNGAIFAIGQYGDLATPDVAEKHFPGGTIIPGLCDAHFHPIWYADLLHGISLKSATSITEVQKRLRRAAEQRPGGEAIHASRLDDDHLVDRRLPTATELDDAVADRPVIVTRYCGHVASVNTAALAAAGVTSATPDPPGGSLDRDDAGTPTGVLRETAIGIVSDAVPRPRVQPNELLHAMRMLAGLGLTSIGAMLRFGDEVDAMVAVADRLPIKVHAYVIAETTNELRAAKLTIDAASGRLIWQGLKRFADGSFGAHTAAMFEPFADVDTIGTMRLTDHDAALAKESLALGGDVAFHGIGDRAVAAILDQFEDLIADGYDPTRFRIEHASVLTGDLIDRFARTGVIASVQPAFLPSEIDWLETRVGTERLPRTYPLRSLLDAGALLAGGSDCPVEAPNPFWGMAAAIDRAGIVPEEGLTSAEALALFTQGSGAALKQPPPVAIGSPADFIVVDRNPLTATPDELRTTIVLETYVDGVPVLVDRSLPWWDV
ncbi:N-substituted formamide deformylase precursor [bacterium BMS3Bbin02]|nr:N-substituted formamide deformylase precursor [bacterium BMS3Bbin02]